jgi:hypothetical protein
VIQAVELLLYRHKALNSNLSSTKKTHLTNIIAVKIFIDPNNKNNNNNNENLS